MKYILIHTIIHGPLHQITENRDIPVATQGPSLLAPNDQINPGGFMLFRRAAAILDPERRDPFVTRRPESNVPDPKLWGHRPNGRPRRGLVEGRALTGDPHPRRIAQTPEAPPSHLHRRTTPWIPPPEDPPPSAPDILDATAVLQCVPFARYMSGIGLHGDAWTWWDDAAGIYARGNRPEPGAILSFPGIERMPLGHVAVVTQVLSQRKILIDHANWPNAIVLHGAISHDIQVVDVSLGNDWSEVRVQFGEGGPLGSVYPVNGFIYGWSETGVQLAQPRFSLDYALWSPVAPSLRMFNAITYLWALPPAERRKAYAAAGVMPPIAPHPRSELVLGPAGSRPDNNAAQRTGLGVIRLDTGLDGRPCAASTGLWCDSHNRGFRRPGG